MLFVFVPLGTVQGRASRISLPGLRVRCRCCPALDQSHRFSRLGFQVLPGRDGAASALARIMHRDLMLGIHTGACVR